MNISGTLIGEYVTKALSLSNRKVFDGDSNAPFRVKIEMAEVGPVSESMAQSGDEGTFWCQVKIPRQVDNCLGGTLIEETTSKEEAIVFLEYLIDQIRGSDANGG